MRPIFTILFAAFMTYGVTAPAAEQDTDALMQQLTQEQRNEYQKQLEQADGDQERNEIKTRYRELAREQTRDASAPGVDCGNRGSGKGGQPGDPCMAGKSGEMKKQYGAGVPAGDKNRPQKSGK